MKKLLLLILLSIATTAVSAQTIGDIYKQYEDAVKAGNKQLAFQLMEFCEKETFHSPFTACALAVLYELGYGTEESSTDALISYLNCQHYEYLLSRFVGESSITAKAMSKMGMEVDVEKLDANQRRMVENYKNYLKPSDKDLAILKAFACRKAAFSNIEGYEEYQADGDVEGMLVSAGGIEEDCLAADSLANDAYASYLLGKLYYEGMLGVKDKALGLKYFKASADRDCISALVYLAKLDIKKGDKASAKKLLQRASQQQICTLVPLTLSTIKTLANPNFDDYDTRKCQEEAKELLKTLK